MSDPIVDYLKKHNIPVTRDAYVNLNWMGSHDPSKPLPAELEAELPRELQLKNDKEKAQ